MDETAVGTQPLTNWAGNYVYRAARVHAPTSLDELQEVVRTGRSLRVLGSRHSFNDIADTTGDLVSLDRMPRVFELDAEARTVTVDGAARYGEVCGPLDEAGFALPNLASLPHISVAGSCATATHGSGDRNAALATSVSAIEVVTADGELRRFSRDHDGDIFRGVVVSLGGVGVITAVTLDVEPAFRMRQDVYEDLPLAAVAEHFDEVVSSADSVSLMTEWRAPTFTQVWLKRRTADEDGFEAPRDLFGATPATGERHPIRGMSPDACTPQLGVIGPWHARLPHFRMDHTPSSGDELQSEYIVPRKHAVDALLALDAIRDEFGALVQVSEIRTIAPDDMWLSMASGRASVGIHFTWIADWQGVRAVLPSIERALEPFDPRPHWGKLFTMVPEAVRASYPKLPAFAELVRDCDPDGTFRNAYVDRYID